MPSITSICKFNRGLCDFPIGLCHLSRNSIYRFKCAANTAQAQVFWRLEIAEPRQFNGLPAQRLFKKRDRQFSLSLQGSLIELLEQIEQCAHAARATGQDKMPDLVGEVQAAT